MLTVIRGMSSDTLIATLSVAVTPQLATGKHHFCTTTLYARYVNIPKHNNISRAHNIRVLSFCYLKCYINYIVGLNLQTGIKRMDIKNRPYSTECKSIIIEEINYELSIQHKRA